MAKRLFSTRLGTEMQRRKFAVRGKQSVSTHSTAVSVGASL